jgi:hypothetical protein
MNLKGRGKERMGGVSGPSNNFLVAPPMSLNSHWEVASDHSSGGKTNRLDPPNFPV